MTISLREFSKNPPTLDALQHLVAADLSAVNNTILRYIQSNVSLIEQLARHLIASGGKRLRPSLTLATAKLLGYNGNRHIALAACVEFIHSATLLHDDVVDASDLRRGEATANAIWGNEASVLVGDFLLSRAFQMMVDDGSLDVLRVLADASATIAAGEVKQLMLKGQLDIGEADYFDVIHAKTATLFAAACELSAIVSGSEEDRVRMHDFGVALGTAFQLIDDALDYSGDMQLLGKTIGDDLREGKATYPVLVAYRNATPENKAFLQQIFNNDALSENTSLTRVQQILASTGAISATRSMAAQHIQKAHETLAYYPHGPAREALHATLDFCLRREL